MRLRSDSLLSCIERSMLNDNNRLKLETLAKRLREQVLEPKWATPEWQQIKRLIADIVATCFCKVYSCHVYLLDMHGGEPSEGLGDKDVDLALDCNDSIDVERLEKILEAFLWRILNRVSGHDVGRIVKIPNIIELHSVDEFIIKRYVKAGPPLAFKLC